MLRKISFLILSAIFFAGVPVFAQAPARKVFSNSVPSIVAHLTPIGRFPLTNRLHLAIGLPVRNPAALDELLRQIYDPASTNFHQYLTPQEFSERFGPTEQDYQTVIQFAKSNGLTAVEMYPNRMLVDVEGNVSDIEHAFQVTMRVYQHPTEARTFYAPDVEPSVAAGIPVLSVGGLDNYALPHPNSSRVESPAVVTPKSGSGPGGTYAGNDFRTAYIPGVTLDGSGQSVALLEFDGYYSNDIASYENSFGLPAVNLTNIAVDGGVNKPGSGNSEVALDIEMAVAMAPGLSKVIVYEAPNTSPWQDIIGRIANDNLARQISCSWGGGSPDPTSEQLFKQMATQGQSFFNASGDSDAFIGSIPFPSDSTNITQVGGTTLTTGANGSWSSETVWNWGRQRHGYVGSSGGISTYYSIPIWQQGIDMTANGGSTTMRNVPDVAFTADNVYVLYNSGGSGTFGGTSCAAPLWAAFTALVNQQNAAAGRPAAGFVNPAVYAIGKGANYAADFHDITTGNNFTRFSPNNFAAVPGYDLCTGWGTPNGSNLIAALTGVINSNPPPPVANFSSSPTNGAVPLTAIFNNLSSGATNYVWDFGDGKISWLTNPSHTYTNAGSYSVTLTAFGSGGTNVLTRFNYIIVTNVPPSISQPPQSLTILAGSDATFSVATGGTVPMGYQWRFNSTNIAGAITNSYTRSNAQPADAGNYSVVVTNIAGVVTSSVAVLTVTSPPPVAAFSAAPTNGGSPLAVDFSNFSSGATNYSWDFGDGHFSAGIAPTNVYHSAGSYTVALTASGPGGQTTLVRSNYIVLSNSPPVLSPITGQTVLEGTLLTVVAAATDPDVNQHLSFSLDANALSGTDINPTNGMFSWTPDESQGPATNQIAVVVTDDGSPPLSATQTFQVVVLESNLPPVLSPIADRAIHAGMTLMITNSATDPDIPANVLTFSLTNFPAGAAVNPSNGIFTWTPDNAFAGTTNGVTVRVTDNGIPPLSDSKTFFVTVAPPPSFLPGQPIALSGDAVTLSWSAISGLTYRVQFNDDLGTTNWMDLPPDITATNLTASKTDVVGTNGFRFYRVFPLP